MSDPAGPMDDGLGIRHDKTFQSSDMTVPQIQRILQMLSSGRNLGMEDQAVFRHFQAGGRPPAMLAALQRFGQSQGGGGMPETLSPAEYEERFPGEGQSKPQGRSKPRGVTHSSDEESEEEMRARLLSTMDEDDAIEE